MPSGSMFAATWAPMPLKESRPDLVDEPELVIVHGRPRSAHPESGGLGLRPAPYFPEHVVTSPNTSCRASMVSYVFLKFVVEGCCGRIRGA
jgi:hypothetical protein